MLKVWFMIVMVVNVAFSANSFMSLEELLTQAQRWKVDVGFQFNQVKETVFGANVEKVEIFPGLEAPLTIPYSETIDQNSIGGILSVKYGINASTELYASFHHQWKWVMKDKNITRTAVFSSNHNQFRLGVNQKILKESYFPAIIAYFETAPFEYIETDLGMYQSTHFSMFHGGLRIYKSIDPVVINVILGSTKHRTKTSNRIKYGDEFEISPSLYFTINDEITLNWGMLARYNEKQFRSGKLAHLSQRQLSFNMGLGYMIEYDWTMSVNGIFSHNNYGGSIQSSYQF
tara:strand:- start:480 stop:1343 length:864 start_codon:yes stop_codon:yes gene_type:complete